jgi:hypothetical protein
MIGFAKTRSMAVPMYNSVSRMSRNGLRASPRCIRPPGCVASVTNLEHQSCDVDTGCLGVHAEDGQRGRAGGHPRLFYISLPPPLNVIAGTHLPSVSSQPSVVS